MHQETLELMNIAERLTTLSLSKITTRTIDDWDVKKIFPEVLEMVIDKFEETNRRLLGYQKKD